VADAERRGGGLIGELVAIAIVVVLPATLGLGLIAALGLAVVGFALDPEEWRLVRPTSAQPTTGPASRISADAPSA
jgi:hypothetical protein